jgi:S-adenosylmethionine hydrolase
MNETIISKDKFSEVWSDIQSSKLPIKQRRIYKEFKVTLHNYVQYKLYLAGHSHFHQYKGQCIARKSRDLWV